MHFLDAFEQARVPVEVEIAVPTHRAVVLPEVSGDSSPLLGPFTLVETELAEELTPFAAWVAYGGRLRALARVLGGGLAMETHRSVVTGAERHVITFVGPRMEI